LPEILLEDFEHRLRSLEGTARLFEKVDAEKETKNKIVSAIKEACGPFKTYKDWSDEWAHRARQLREIIHYMKTNPNYKKQIHGEAPVNTACKITKIAYWRSPE